ncbi:Peptidase family U32 [uncultured archaeon]|nr:Peptidase family U32 [uncultured archaeon]
MKQKYELLAPAGDMSCLVAAVNAGADSVYLGLKEFSMRATARNFSIKELEEVRKICKEHKVKIYLTVNTIIYQDELKKIEKILQEIKKKKLVDAVICWDLSVVELCKKLKISFHISTQASISNSSSANFYKKLGAERVVLARELSLKQIKELIKKTKVQVETFCHGALCVSESGRCFTSQFLFNKSANRGECLQPCRRTYTIRDEDNNELKLENNRVMSPKDLCTLPFIEKMKAAGIKAYKIEGRNRDARYVDSVVRVYRKALDKKLTRKEVEEGLKELDKVYHRGFSSGFFLGTPTNDDFSKQENSSSKEKKHFVGKVVHFFPNVSVAAIKVSSEFKVGEELIFLGDKTGVVREKVVRIEINRKPVDKAEKGQEVGIKVSSAVKVGDEVYKIVR